MPAIQIALTGATFACALLAENQNPPLAKNE